MRTSRTVINGHLYLRSKKIRFPSAKWSRIDHPCARAISRAGATARERSNLLLNPRLCCSFLTFDPTFSNPLKPQASRKSREKIRSLLSLLRVPPCLSSCCMNGRLDLGYFSCV